MKLNMRRATREDAAVLGQINYDAFKKIADDHGFPPDFATVDDAVGAVTSLASNPGVYSVVAEADGKIAGSNFMDERNPIAGIGPISVDPSVQNQTIGRSLMEDVLARARSRNFAGVRLVQTAYHNRSLCLYTKLGFETREPLSVLQGKPLNLKLRGYEVRAATDGDLDACNRLCARVHGHHRGGELHDAIRSGMATVVERLGRVTGYATVIAFFGHAVGESNDDIRALIGAAPMFMGPGILVPTRNGELFRWCLANGMRLVQQMTLMTIGLYNEPTGAYLPSIHY
ncbi:MAG TPA: GNAT family N-acetyltransferase [Candidatus Binataceae bacterium]|nr:GNAT family N-acetyltransferase [Candidatus Binataceae bacterium]